MRRIVIAALFGAGLLLAARPGDWIAPEAEWLLNEDGRRGRSPDARVQAIVGKISADVQRVAYEPEWIRVWSTGIPSYAVGPFNDRNPSIPTDRGWAFRIPRAPRLSDHPSDTWLGPIGVFLNGVPMYNMHDGHSFRNEGVWNQNAVVWRAGGMDAAGGHPSPAQGPQTRPVDGVVPGLYHHHQLPKPLLEQLGDQGGAAHSPLIGYSFDGFPVYGPYGYANADGSGGVRRMRPSWRMKDFDEREDGPPAEGRFPPGSFVEDFEFVEGLGDLDVYNGRVSATPEYPAGVYAYFATVDENGTPAFPYLLGPQYRGEAVRQGRGPGPAGRGPRRPRRRP